MLNGVSHQVAEGLAFVVLASRLGNPEEADDFAALLLRVSMQRIFLNLK